MIWKNQMKNLYLRHHRLYRYHRDLLLQNMNQKLMKWYQMNMMMMTKKNMTQIRKKKIK